MAENLSNPLISIFLGTDAVALFPEMVDTAKNIFHEL